MKQYIAFLKKEIIESIHMYKLLIMLIVFLIFGVMSPIIAKLTPYFIGTLMPEGSVITLPDPSALDSWIQFFGNITQMGLMVMMIVFSSSLGSEIAKGTLINMLTKGLARKVVILSKYTCMAFIWTISIIFSFLVTLGYTVYLFPNGGIVNLLFSIFCLWLFGMLLLALLVFASTLINTSYGSLLIVGSTVVVFMVLNIIFNFNKYNPLLLSTKNVDLLTNNIAVSSLYGAIGITLVLMIVFIVLSILIFRKKQL